MNDTPNDYLESNAAVAQRSPAAKRNASDEDANAMEKMSGEELKRTLELELENDIKTEALVESQAETADALEECKEALAESEAETADALDKCTELFDNSPTNYFNFSADGTITELNLAAANIAGGVRDGLVDTNFKQLLSVLDRTRFEEYLKRLFGGGAAESFEVAISKEGCDEVHIVVESVMSADGTQAQANVFDVSEQHKSEADRKIMVAELEVALDEVKQLNGLLPICLTCKKIRDDAGQWTDVELYIAKHSEASFSQGLCPKCYPEFHR